MSMDNRTTMWHNRATILAEFTSQPSRESSGEDLTIEWSSSDEEVIQSIHHPSSAYETGVCSSMNYQQSEKYENSIENFSDQRLFSGDEEGQVSLQKPDDGKTLLSTSCNEEKKHNCQGLQSSLPSFKHHDLIKMENEMDIRKSESLLPISGRCDGALSCTDAQMHKCKIMNVLEPQSPVLGSGRILARSCSPILRGRKVQMKTSFDVLKKKLTFSNAVSVKRRINNDDVSVNVKFSAAATGRTGDFNDVHDIKPDKCIIHPSSVQNRLTQSPEKINYSLVTPRDCRREHTPSDFLEEVIQLDSHGSQDNSKTLDVNLNPLLRSDLSLSEEHLGLDIGEYTYESISVTLEGADDHLDHNTKATAILHENPINDINIPEENESSASATGLLVLDSNTRSGFDWVKHLQTPQKLLSDENVDGMESTKKKLLKDGQAQHLKHMLMSWRSCITLWSHKFSLTTLCGMSPRQSSPLPSKIQHHGISINDAVKLESQEEKGEVKSMCSPSVKNLQDLMADNTASSPDTHWSSSYKVSPKYLDLRLIDVGGQLPSNAALCEATGSNVEEFQMPLEIKNDNVEAAETRKTKKFLVFFALDEHSITGLYKFNTVRIYATWQNLSVSAHDIPTLFTSYFKFNCKEETSPLPVDHRRTVLHTWTCSDKLTSTSLCEPCAFPWVSSAQAGNTLYAAHSGLTTIKDMPESPPQNGKASAGTILEALEKCGGISAVPVSITIRIQRTVIQREPSGSAKFWELIGQDAAGQFCIVKIPNWPLAHQLMEALNDAAKSHSTHTFTYLMMTHRLTNTQNPGLFSLITSLHNSYQRSVLGNLLLQPFLQDLASCPPQTHCYVFTVSLGVTKLLNNGEQISFPINLPQLSLQESLQMSQAGQRCNLTVYVLYKTSSNLHIMSHASHQEESSLFATGKEARETKLQETLLISRVILMGVTLPLRWPESGPVMLSVVLKDAVVWHGSLAADKYSFIEVQEKGKAMIDNAVLNQALSPLSDVTQEDSLTLVSGTIIKAEEENAFIHFICGNCKSDKIQEAADGHIDCISCGHKSVLHSQGYFLEVWLDCGPDLQQTYVKVKLYQKTIKKLLLACCGPQEEKYSATCLLGHHIGPMACVLLQLQRPHHCSNWTCILAELPY